MSHNYGNNMLTMRHIHALSNASRAVIFTVEDNRPRLLSAGLTRTTSNFRRHPLVVEIEFAQLLH
jgi:hypothetical protein